MDTKHPQEFDDLCGEANARNWFFMVTEWAGPPTKAMAVVACDEIEQRCYEGEASTALGAMTEAMTLARASEIDETADSRPASPSVAEDIERLWPQLESGMHYLRDR